MSRSQCFHRCKKTSVFLLHGAKLLTRHHFKNFLELLRGRDGDLATLIAACVWVWQVCDMLT